MGTSHRSVMAGLVPAFPIGLARPCLPKRDARVKPAHDDEYVARSSAITPTASLDRLGIDGRAGAAGNDERRAAEEELVDAVLVAVLGQFLEIEDLAHAQAHGRDHHPVPRLVGVLGLVRPHFNAPGIGADGGDLLVLAPIAVLELHARRVAAGVAAPLLLLKAPFQLAGTDDDEIAAADLDVLVLGAFVELVVGDPLAVLEPIDAAVAG